MFNINDKVVYPLHGAGTIDSIEEHEVLGEIQKYYIVRLLVGGMKVMVPIIHNMKEQISLRKVIKKDEIDKVMDMLENAPVLDIQNWKIRYQTNLEKMKTGCIYKAAEVARSLSCRNKEKGLSSAEKRLFETAYTAITSEIAFSQGIGLEEANTMINSALIQN